jgi:glycerophosphoryl diester phosphodiesterase
VLNVEIKTDDGDPTALARATASVLAPTRPQLHQVIVSSFDPAALVALRTVDPSLPRGLLLSNDPAEAAAALSRVRDVLPNAMHPHFSLCTPERVRAWKAQGLRVNVWTVDAPDEARRVAALGVDAIISNEPGAIRAALTSA